MFRKRYYQQIPELNTTSTADISFMLLIFFLVTSSMDTDKGLLRQMAPLPAEQEQPTDIEKNFVMRVEIDELDRLTCDGKSVTDSQLSEAVVSMASINRTSHVIAVKADRATSYEAYFRMQNDIVRAYATLRNQYALQHYGRRYDQLTSDERAAVNEYYPQRISEAPIVEEGGER